MTVLTQADVVALGVIVNAADATAKVARALPDGNVAYGIARHIVKDVESAGFLNSTDDVRDGYLRVTLRSGWEVFWPVRTLMNEVHTGEFNEYDWSGV